MLEGRGASFLTRYETKVSSELSCGEHLPKTEANRGSEHGAEKRIMMSLG